MLKLGKLSEEYYIPAKFLFPSRTGFQVKFRHVLKRNKGIFWSFERLDPRREKENLAATSISVCALALSFDTNYMLCITSFFHEGVST